MHTFIGHCGTSFNFNSDLSGEVIVIFPDGCDAKIPAIDLYGFAAEIMKREAEYKLEALEWTTGTYGDYPAPGPAREGGE